ncbi:MAG: MetS family NSS transporter small subunit [Thermoplasmatales archaeon]|nr:MAG: MetS family NSS transporter small subunit [Thermoplasmatales archaeon]
MILPISAIAMLIFGSVVLYGGLAYFLYKALKTKSEW